MRQLFLFSILELLIVLLQALICHNSNNDGDDDGREILTLASNKE